jgi:hypothetical protein
MAGCSKKTTTSPPIHDTTVVVKIDTLVVPPPPDPTVNLSQGLLLYLPFNGSIADSSGNNNPTTLVGSGNGLTYDAHGYANSAFYGNGSNAVLVTNNGSIDFDTAFSMSYDFMITVSTRQMLITMVDPNTGNGPSWISGLFLSTEPNLAYYVNDQSVPCNLAGYSGADSVIVSDTTSFIPLLNTWYNVIEVYLGGSGYTYINGQLIGKKVAAGTGALICPSAQIAVGGWWSGDPIRLNGKMDEVRFYNRVLTPHEIVRLSQHYQVTSESTRPKAVIRR